MSLLPKQVEHGIRSLLNGEVVQKFQATQAMVFRGLRRVLATGQAAFDFILESLLGDWAVRLVGTIWDRLPDAPVDVARIVQWTAEQPATTAVIVAALVTTVTAIAAYVETRRATRSPEVTVPCAKVRQRSTAERCQAQTSSSTTLAVPSIWLHLCRFLL